MGEIENLILKILESTLVDEKIKLRKETVELFKNFNSANNIPIAIQLNLSLHLREIIDNFIVQDNHTSRETLKNFFLVNNLYLQEAS